MSYEVRFSKVAYKDVGGLTPRLKKKLKDIITGQIALIFRMQENGLLEIWLDFIQ